MRPLFFGLSEIPQLESAFSDADGPMIWGLLPKWWVGDASLSARPAGSMRVLRWL